MTHASYGSARDDAAGRMSARAGRCRAPAPSLIDLMPFSKHAVRHTLLALALLAPAAGARRADAQASLLVNTNAAAKGVYDEIYVGGQSWHTTTTSLQSTFGPHLGTTPALTDLSAMLQYDALWVDQRYMDTPSAGELANLVAYANTGRRVVVVGENASWGGWNAAILGALGGTEGGPFSGSGSPGCRLGGTNTALAHALTAGVASVNMACGGYAVGGTSLFDYGVATLWGASQNVLVVLDANLFDDRFMQPDGVRFEQNVVTWLAGASTTAPEPATFALLGTGLLALGGIAARRRRASRE
jgi:hypothetical protein